VNDGYTFGLSCPRCGSEVRHVSATTPPLGNASTAAAARVRCPAGCGDFRIQVTLSPVTSRRPFDIAPLADTLNIAPDPHLQDKGPLGALSIRLSATWGVSEKSARARVYRLARAGLSVYDADALATALGEHPGNVWGDAWWDAMVGDDELVDADA